MDTHLAQSPSGYLVGDRVTIADIACWGWVAGAKWSGVDINEFPALKKWLHTLLERPGFEKGRHVPTPHKSFEMENQTEEELEEKAKEAQKWVQKGMQDEAKK